MAISWVCLYGSECLVGTHMQRRDALLVGVRRIELAAVEQLLDSLDLAQTRQLHNVLLDGEVGLLVGHVVELMLPAGAAFGGAGGHLGSPLRARWRLSLSNTRGMRAVEGRLVGRLEEPSTALCT